MYQIFISGTVGSSHRKVANALKRWHKVAPQGTPCVLTDGRGRTIAVANGFPSLMDSDAYADAIVALSTQEKGHA